jgi:hypothetical protein
VVESLYPWRKRALEGKKKEVDHIESGYKGKKIQLERYNTQSPSS